MPKNSESVEFETETINLKHRITGAAVLIFFGILVLPWLLGPPSEAQKNVDLAEQSAAQERHSTFEEEVLSTLQETDESFDELEETVYVSKITPVDGNATVVSPPVGVGDNGAEVDSDNDASTKGSVATQSARDSEDKVTKPSTQAASKEVVATKPVNEVIEKPSTKPVTNASETSAAVASTDKPKSQKKVDVGWVVQVELLTDKQGAKRLVEELDSKGFKPHTTIVDTNRGKKTGTRIWLGPFEQRAQAGIENDRLETRMGKRGFVRVYP